MKLLLDIGNSRLKYLSLDKGNRDYGVIDYQHDSISDSLSSILNNVPKPDEVYISNVAGDEVKRRLDHYLYDSCQLKARYAQVERSCLGIRNGYRDFTQLGIDRWLGVIACWQLKKGHGLIVDCGTALTIDALIDNKGEGEYIGGLIIPGVQLMKSLLIENTQQIEQEPVYNQTVTSLFGQSTSEGLSVGAVRAISSLIESSYKDFQSECDDTLNCILTGGAAALIQSHLDIPFEHEPHLVLTGLEYWSQLV